MKFSHRFNFDPNRKAGPIGEDAPDWLRNEFIITILDKLTYVDYDSRFENEENQPLGIKSLHERICVETKSIMSQEDWDSFYCNDNLKYTLNNCEWYQFYDCIEVIGEQLRLAEKKYRSDGDVEFLGESTYAEFKFPAYRNAVNKLFEKHHVGWRINSRGHFETALPKDLAERLNSAEQRLIDEFQPARVHFIKAKNYILGTSKDPENSIKESISALESVCKVLYPGTATLGDTLKKMKSEGLFPPKLIEVFQKFYNYTNDEDGVRHGGINVPAVQVLDAEFALHLSVALIRYAIELKKSQPAGQIKR